MSELLGHSTPVPFYNRRDRLRNLAYQGMEGRYYKLLATLIRFCARASAASARGRFKSGASAASCSLARSSALSARSTSISDAHSAVSTNAVTPVRNV